MKLFWRNRTLKQPKEGFSDFWATVDVQLHVRIEESTDSSSPPVIGYFQTLGVRVKSDQVRAVLDSAITDGSINWSESGYDLVEISTLDRDIRRQVVPVGDEGVWYSSGRVFYTPEEPSN